jgi:signal transduction histidine kinase
VTTPKSLKHLLLIHELTFVLLVVLAGAAGWGSIHQWQEASRESHRIHTLIQEVQQTRGDLYRQMKELFDAFFLGDANAVGEYDEFSRAAEKHFWQLRGMAVGRAELDAIDALQKSYSDFLNVTSTLLDKRKKLSREALRNSLNSGLEAGVFSRYETVSAQTEKLLSMKQRELQNQLQRSKQQALMLLIIPVVLAAMLLLFSRIFLQRSIVNPIADVLHATTEISAGRLEYKAPQTGVAELRALAQAINQMADELIRGRESLIRSEKQAAQGALVPMLAHNIRNPLASIRAIAQVADSPRLDNETREALCDIIDTVDRLERWTGTLLAYLLPLKPHQVATSMQDIIRGAIAPLQSRIKEKSILINLPDTPSITITADENMLEQALYNLLLNAIDASPNKGTITIELETLPQSIQLRILDSGAGMPFSPNPEDLSPGPSTKRFGTGLGIPFAFKVLDALGGSIDFAQRDGGGTSVSLTLPRKIRAS